jgi:2OG-Fe(II) oxygenase superfamily
MVKMQSHHDRLANWYASMLPSWSNFEELHAGIFVYRDVITKNMNVIDTLEKTISNNSFIDWQQAMVGYMEYMPEYRDCYDFKYKSGMLPITDSIKELDSMYQKTYNAQLQVVKHYCKKFNVGEMRYWESTNFVKYGKGQHFEAHTDHGFSYNCTVSLVSYPNDDYDGGELEFPLQGIKIKPVAGDTYIFPSNFMYPHRACPVFDGKKYSMVTMLDYSDKYHGQHIETGS